MIARRSGISCPTYSYSLNRVISAQAEAGITIESDRLSVGFAHENLLPVYPYPIEFLRNRSFYEETVKRHVDNSKWYANPDESRVVAGEELKQARSQYQRMLRKDELQKGHHKQGLIFGGENVSKNIQFTGKSTIRHSELEGLDTGFIMKMVMVKRIQRY